MKIVEEIPKHILDDIVCDVDGYYYYWPTNNNGHFAAHHLRQIADHLDMINAPAEKQMQEYWEEQIKKDMEQNPLSLEELEFWDSINDYE